MVTFGFEEASYRTATDRAYLASALLLADILRSRCGIDVPRSARFYAIIEDQAANIDSHLRENLATLRGLRNDADYDLDLMFGKNDATRTIVMAKAMTAWLKGKFR